MQGRIYALPEWNFVGGETQKRSFTLYKPSGSEYDIGSGTANLAVVDFVNRNSTPVINKQVSVTANTNGHYCEVAFTITSAETQTLSGKYIYQITVKDGNGNASIPQQGIMMITYNINQAFLT